MGACNQCINEKREDGGVILDSKRATIRLQAINIEKQKV